MPTASPGARTAPAGVTLILTILVVNYRAAAA